VVALNDSRIILSLFYFQQLSGVIHSQPMSGDLLRQIIKSGVAGIGLDPAVFRVTPSGWCWDLFAACVPYQNEWAEV
jgi:hypothetical protein